MTDTKEPREPWGEQELNDMAQELVLAMMRSASTDKIDPKKWWERAKTALETGAACADNLSQMVSRMGEKLEIESLTSESCNSISFLTRNIGEQFAEFRSLCERDALYIVAMARVQNDERKATAKAAKKARDEQRANDEFFSTVNEEN